MYKEFYSEFGKLLYSVVDIDGVINKKEKQTLRDIVKNELVPTEKHTDAFGTNAAYYSEMEFDFLDEEICDAEAAFESFIDFVEDHHTAFDESMKKVCLHLVKRLSAAYRGTNKKEKLLIEKLRKKHERIDVRNIHSGNSNSKKAKLLIN
jgi:hypothetical protein